MKKILKIMGIVFACLIVLMIAAVIFIKSSGLPEEPPVINIGSIDLANVKDGSYEGQCDAGLVKVTVKVTVQENKITAVDILKHDNGLGKKAEKIIGSVMDKQSLDVDVISGATISSKAILKAIENALTNQV